MSRTFDGWTMQQEYVKCGKKGCTKLHGPYWYGYRTVDGKTRKKYFGKSFPTDDFLRGKGRQEKPPDPPKSPKGEQAHPNDIIFDKNKRTIRIARKIFGNDSNSYEECKKHYRQICRQLHPDCNGGLEGPFKRFCAAWEFICWVYNWEEKAQRKLF